MCSYFVPNGFMQPLLFFHQQTDLHSVRDRLGAVFDAVMAAADGFDADDLYELHLKEPRAENLHEVSRIVRLLSSVGHVHEARREGLDCRDPA